MQKMNVTTFRDSLIAVAFALFTSQGAFCEIIKASISSPGGYPVATVGFWDSSFDDGKISFCYLGSVSKVCADVDRAVKIMQKSYAEGDHDTIKILSCEIKDKNKVALSYDLIDDYMKAGESAHKDFIIEKCSKNI